MEEIKTYAANAYVFALLAFALGVLAPIEWARVKLAETFRPTTK